MNALIILFAAWPFAVDVSPDQVVARADGPRGQVTITADRLRRYAEARPDRSPRALATELLELELLAAEAVAKGLDTGEDIDEAAREALVSRYLALFFEVEWRHETIPEPLLRKSYLRNKGVFNRPELRNAIHVVVLGPKATKIPLDSPLGPVAKAFAEKIAAEFTANPPADDEAFKAAGEAFQTEAEAVGLTLNVDALGRFGRTGRFVKAFTTPAFEITEAGTLSEPFRTMYGWHVMRVTEVIPARKESFEQAEEELRRRILPEVRDFELRKLTDELAERYSALVNFEPLQQLEDRRTGK